MPGRTDLEALLAYARAQQRDDPARSLALFENVAERASTAEEILLEADAWLGCGESAGLIDGRERESLPYLRRAAELAPGTTIAALAWMSAGDMLRFCGEAGPAARAYSQAVIVFEGLGDAFGECLARQALAALLVSEGRAEEALPHFVCASSLALDTDEPEMAAGLQLTLGQELSGLKRDSEAISPLTASAELSRLIGNGQLEARARGALLNALHSTHPGFGAVHREQLVRLAELSAANAASEGNAEAGGAAQFMLSALMGVQEKGAPDLTGDAAGTGRQEKPAGRSVRCDKARHRGGQSPPRTGHATPSPWTWQRRFRAVPSLCGTVRGSRASTVGGPGPPRLRRCSASGRPGTGKRGVVLTGC